MLGSACIKIQAEGAFYFNSSKYLVTFIYNIWHRDTKREALLFKTIATF
jgi:hypothetical protein